VLFGWLGDRIGRVRAMVVSVLLYSLLTGASALAQSATQLAMLRFVAALGMGGEWALGVALVVETWPESARPWLAGLIGAAVNLGYVGVAAIKSLMGSDTSWRTMFVVCACPALLTFFLRSFVPESARWQAAVETKTQPRLRKLFSGPLRRQTLFGTLSAAILLIAVWGAIQFTQLWADQLGGPRAAEQTQMVSAGAATIGALLAPLLLARLSRRWSYFLLSAMALVSAEYLFLGQSQFNARFLLAVGIAGLFTGAFNGWLPLYLPELFPTRLRASGQGTSYNAGRVLAALAVFLSTGPLDVRGHYPQACAWVAGIYGVGCLLAWWLPETGGKLPD